MADSPVVATIKRLFKLTDEQATALMPNGPDSQAHLIGGIIDFDADNEGMREKNARENAEQGWRVIR